MVLYRLSKTNYAQDISGTGAALFGETWVAENKSLALKVPSSVEPNSYNYILNCVHPKYAKVKIIDIEPFYIDIRLLKK